MIIRLKNKINVCLKSRLCILCTFFSISFFSFSQVQNQDQFRIGLIDYSIQSGSNIIKSPFNWETKDYLNMLSGFSLFTLAYTNDQKIYDYLQSKKTPFSEKISWVGEKWGNGTFVGGVYALSGLSAIVFSNEDLKAFCKKGMVSGFYTSVAILSLKQLFQRKRPYMSSHPYEFGSIMKKPHYHSLPSGHTAMAFNLATVIAHSSDNKIHGALAYAMAFLTAWSRVHDQKHWASDVVLGGVLSVAITTTVINTYDKRKP